MQDEIAVLLLPGTRENFILRDQADDLLECENVIAVEPHGVPYGALGRMPDAVAKRVAREQAKRLSLPGKPRAIAIFHPFQVPLAEALLDRFPECELWYGRWDRYEHAYDAGKATRRKLEALHTRAAKRAALTFVASEKLAELEREQGREATLVPLAADSFPTPDPTNNIVAVSLGHLGYRTDWRLLHQLAVRMPELTLLMVGERHDDECKDDVDLHACKHLDNFIWLGGHPNEEAARLILCADVGIVPFRVEPFNDAGLPYRILKYALLGRRTISPDLAGVKTWANAVTCAQTIDEWVAALAAAARTRSNPDLALREWALEQTAHKQNEPLWERLEVLGLTS